MTTDELYGKPLVSCILLCLFKQFINLSHKHLSKHWGLKHLISIFVIEWMKNLEQHKAIEQCVGFKFAKRANIDCKFYHHL